MAEKTNIEISKGVQSLISILQNSLQKNDITEEQTKVVKQMIKSLQLFESKLPFNSETIKKITGSLNKFKTK